MKDSLFRLSLKAFIQNDRGEVLVVKEIGRDWWDLPGGGIEGGESIQQGLARELNEEVGYEGGFSCEIMGVDDPHKLLRGVWQVRLVFKVTSENMNFSVGTDGDEIAWKNPDDFATSESSAERLTCFYARKLRGDMTYDPHVPLNETKKRL